MCVYAYMYVLYVIPQCHVFIVYINLITTFSVYIVRFYSMFYAFDAIMVYCTLWEMTRIKMINQSINQSIYIYNTTRMLVAFGICLKQYFDTRYLVFYNTSPPRMFLSLDFLWEYRIQHGANGPLYVTPSYSTWIFCRGVWCRGLTTCLLHVGPPFGNRILNNSWAVGLT